MLHKNKSKQILKLKYLLLIPVLISMLVYTSCDKSEIQLLNKNKKRLITLYIGDGINTESKEIKTEEVEGYFDIYMLGAKPLSKKEISFDNLNEEEKNDYNQTVRNRSRKEDRKFYSYKIYQNKDGTKVLFEEIDWNGMKANEKPIDYTKLEEVPFAVIGKAPIYPGCEDDKYPKKCLQESISKHVNQNFDTHIANSLGLKSGKKRVYVMFTIDKNGNISKIRARAPHEALEEEALRVIKSLPQMIPGEHNGKIVAVKYVLPITLVVD